MVAGIPIWRGRRFTQGKMLSGRGGPTSRRTLWVASVRQRGALRHLEQSGAEVAAEFRRICPREGRGRALEGERPEARRTRGEKSCGRRGTGKR